MEKKLSQEVIEILYNYDWLGNIRELRNLIEYLIIVSKNNEISTEDLPFNIVGELIEKASAENIENISKCCMQLYSKMPLKEATEKFQKEIIEILLKNGNNKLKIAKMLEVNPSTISRKFSKF